MRLISKEKKALTYLSKAAENDAGGILIDDIAKQLDTQREEAMRICNTLAAHGLIDKFGGRHFKMATAGMEQLKPCWRRHIVLIVGVATLFVAAVAAVFTILLYLRGCEAKEAVLGPEDITGAKEKIDSRLRGNDGGNQQVMEEL